MRKIKIALLAILTLAVSLAGLAGVSSAQQFRTEVDDDQVVNSSLYSAGRSVTIRGTVNGDIYCAGQTVLIEATVRGDVICTGQNVFVGGTVDGDVRVAGQHVTIHAKVARSLTAAGQDLYLSKDGSIGQDATLTGNLVTLDGKVGRDVVSASSGVIVKGEIGRNLRHTGQQLELHQNALVKGNVDYESKRELIKTGNATVNGIVTRAEPKHQSNEGSGAVLGLNFFGIAGGLSILLFALVLAAFLPGPVHRAANAATNKWGRTFLIGLAAAIGMPVLFVALLLSFIGWPLALAVLLGWVLLALLSGPIAAYALGLKLFHGRTNVLSVMFLGSLLLVLAYYVPVLGILAMLAAYLFGSGALVLAIKRHWVKPDYVLAGDASAKRK